MWRTKPPDPEQVARLRLMREKHDLRPLVIHDSYLINLASPPSLIREKSIDGFRGEIERAIVIGAEYLVAHPGNYKGLTIEQGIVNVAEAIGLAWRGVETSLASSAKLTILLENTAGAGAQLGGKLEELRAIRELVAPYLGLPIGFCLDTCHCHAAGFDIGSESGLQSFVHHAENILALQRVPVMHANDAKAPLGSHLDRHANIGKGFIGIDGFRRILNHPAFADKSFVLETPVDKPGDDLRNVRALKSLASKPLDAKPGRRSQASKTKFAPISTV